MPLFTKEDHSVEMSTNVDVHLEVSPSEFLNQCEEEEIDEVYDWLDTNGYLEKELNLPDSGSYSDSELNNALTKISDARLQLTNDDLEELKRIAGKYR